MPANKMPEMPEAVAWSSGLDWHPNPRHESEMIVQLTRKEQVENGFTLGLYTADQMRAMYLAGIADARAVVESSERYEASIGGGCECCGTWVDIDPDKHGDLLRRKETLTNLTALEQEAKK